jgi:predicted metal-dependent phosphoesterase TrpH
MVVADLHVHTTNSDGTLTLSSLEAAAGTAGVSAVAVTDHDRLHPDLRTPVADVGDLTVVNGIELRVDAGHERVDLLGYGVRRTDELAALVERLQADRIERGRRIVECVEDRLGVELAVDLEAGVGRPHVARAVADATEYSYEDAFEEFIGSDGPCYVARDVPSFREGLAVLADACGLVSLAHPLRYDDPTAALALCADLDAVERHYPYGRDVDPTPIERAVDRHDLLVTGGSDAHEEVLGRAGLGADDYRRFRAAL